GVGKSAITIQFIRNQFVEEYDPTIEDSYRKQLSLPDGDVELDILDTAGQEEYSAMRGQYICSGDGFLLVYSIDSHDAFEEVKAIYSQILLAKQDQSIIPVILIGNKCDLINSRAVPIYEAQGLAQSWKIPFIETSAKLDLNIKESFVQLVYMMRKYRNSIGILPPPSAARSNFSNPMSAKSFDKTKDVLPGPVMEEDGIQLTKCCILL
ncbi:ras-like protein, partial [Neoconidiobolus thromboides FSU 785]